VAWATKKLSHDDRQELHGREHILEDVLAQLGAPVH
jgi:hypothetical protein